MAIFQDAYDKLSVLEGGWAEFDGGTYRGISFRWNSNDTLLVDMWKIIFDLKDTPGFPRTIPDDALAGTVRQFYHDRYWYPLRGEMLKSQKIAEELLESSVHIGLGKPTQWLQRVLNHINQGTWDVLTVDGDLGLKTVIACNKATAAKFEDVIYKSLNALQLVYYLNKRKDLFVSFIRNRVA